ncbi:MAG: DNA repair protein RecO C-terminal domain-containing protein, partial [Congregibacter sp.]|nr:DNA repair protein RecO C-terminal domain-containing protein [Congregibacter sp.]
LRRFEFRLLEELGYAVDMDQDAVGGGPICSEACYILVPELGFREVSGTTQPNASFRGADIIAVAQGRFDGSDGMAAKRMVRTLLHPHLGNAPLRSRSMFEVSRDLPSRLAQGTHSVPQSNGGERSEVDAP